ncbi:hypothetical protein [Stakelama tenebrarum]|uniref:Type II secretion system protein M n=1 Tax=Stakelama tenebrarum TaxID=2711215 RepID=A0A6G6Y4U1_9SPHN|nr:hypothetical protein [Sphingosinithalassobacter tenebrarum]QIG79738.1 hypothetical protein G5C33_07970 [Sphingosinithalassobacter tenebrarum]
MTARPIWLWAAGGLLAALVILPVLPRALEGLAAARTEHARLAAIAERPPIETGALVAEQWRAGQADGLAATRALAHRIRTRAAAAGLLVEQIEARRAPEGLAAVALRVSGSEKSVIAFADRLDREPPIVRFDQWNISAQGDGVVRMGAIAVMVWQ